MKRSLLLGATASAILAVILLTDTESTSTFSPRSEMSSEHAAGRMAKVDLKTLMNTDPTTGQVDLVGKGLLSKAIESYEEIAIPTKSNSMDWISAGPDNVGGRTRAICSDPDDPTKIYIGSVTGGLFKSTDSGLTWEMMESFNTNNSISSIAISGSGNIYVATGSPFESPDISGGNINSGSIGDGMFVSEDDGATFERLQDFYPDPTFSTTNDWYGISEVLPDPVVDDKVWIAWEGGLGTYTDGETDLVAITDFPAGPCRAIDISDDGQHIIVYTAFSFGGGLNDEVWVSNDSGASFDKVSSDNGGDVFGKINSSDCRRIEVAVSPDTPNYMYAVVVDSDSRLGGTWASNDFGETWQRTAGATSNSGGFAPFLSLNGQGFYDCALTVLPGQPTKAILGGVRTYMFTLASEEPLAGNWDQISVQFAFGPNPNYVHSDIHTFHWNDDDVLFIGCDGGIFKSEDYTDTFYPSNYQYRTTQFYGMGFNSRGHLIGGTQDNGTHLITGFNASANNSIQIRGGDGYDSEMSQVDSDFMIGTIYYNDVGRTFNGGLSFGQLVDSAGFPGPFFTTIRMFESRFNEDTEETFDYLVEEGDTLMAGETIEYVSPNLNFDLEHVVDAQYFPGDIVQLPVYNTTILVIGGTGATNSMLLTLDATKQNVTPQFAQISHPSMGTVTGFDFSADGDVLVVGCRNGNVYRLTGLRSVGNISDIEALPFDLISSGSGGYISDLSIDPNDIDRMVFSRGGYNSQNKVFLTENLTDSDPDFDGIWNMPTNNNGDDLSSMPAYSVLIDKNNGGRIIAGTEYGTWVTTDEGDTWTECNDGMGRVPVYDLRQQLWENTNTQFPDVLNEDAIYAGTHGRGLFYVGDYILGNEEQEAIGPLSDIRIYPNPMSESGSVSINLSERSTLDLEILDINGKSVERISQGTVGAGSRVVEFDVNGLDQGTYILNVRAGDHNQTGRFVISR